MRIIPQVCIDLVKESEGLRLHKYADAVNKFTIGYGHLILPSDGNLEIITEAQATELLKKDLQKAGKAVERLITVPLNDNQFSALVDFTFNLGSGCLQASSLRAKLNRYDYYGAADVFPKYIYAGGRILKGLVIRRAKERKLFLT